MGRIEGTATVSIETLDELRQYEKLFNSVQKSASELIESIDAEQYEKECKKIDEMKNVSDKTLMRLCKKATGTLKIIVSDANLKKLIREFLDEEKSDAHCALARLTREEFAKIPLILESGQHSKNSGGQQDKTVCEMCEAYMVNTACDIKNDCPAAGIIKSLHEAEETIKAKEKTIKGREKEIRELKKKLSDSELKRSYMVDPMAIGDRHEMGG